MSKIKLKVFWLYLLLWIILNICGSNSNSYVWKSESSKERELKEQNMRLKVLSLGYHVTKYLGKKVLYNDIQE